MRGAKGREGEGREGWRRVGKKKRGEIRGRAAQSKFFLFFVFAQLTQVFAKHIPSGSRAVIHGSSQNQQRSEGRPGGDV